MNGAPGVEDFAATQLEFARGFHGQLTSIWHHVIAAREQSAARSFRENLFAAFDGDTIGPIIVQRGAGRERGDDRETK